MLKLRFDLTALANSFDKIGQPEIMRTYSKDGRGLAIRSYTAQARRKLAYDFVEIGTPRNRF